MTLITSIADPEANSYCLINEAEDYLSLRYDLTDWDLLTLEQKEQRLILAAATLDSVTTFRGVKATSDQALSFPRLFPKDSLWIEDARNGVKPGFSTWLELQDYADLFSYSPPIIPENVKKAQAEVAFQCIQGLLELDPSGGGVDVSSISIGGKISVAMAQDTHRSKTNIEVLTQNALGIVRIYLAKYIGVRGRLI